MSALDQIRAIHKRHEGRRLLIDLPVWWSSKLGDGSEVVIRCQPISADRIAAVMAPAVDGRGEPVPGAAATAVANLIAEATIDIRVIGPDGTDEGFSPDGPIRFGPELSALMEWDDPPETAAETVERFLLVDERPLAVYVVAAALQQQLAGGIEVAAREALGE